MNAILITDSPHIIELKREFAALTAEGADLIDGTKPLTPDRFSRLLRVRDRKLEIGKELFNQAPN